MKHEKFSMSIQLIIEINRFQRFPLVLPSYACADNAKLNGSSVSKLFYLFALFAMRKRLQRDIMKFIGVDRSQTLVSMLKEAGVGKGGCKKL